MRNEAPIPSKILRRELENLKNVECPSKKVGVGDFRHVVEHNYRKCPLCYIQRVAEVALERFDDKPGEQAPEFCDWGGDRGGGGEAERRQETSIAMDSRHSLTSRPSGSSNFVSCTGDHAPV